MANALAKMEPMSDAPKRWAVRTSRARPAKRDSNVKPETMRTAAARAALSRLDVAPTGAWVVEVVGESVGKEEPVQDEDGEEEDGGVSEVRKETRHLD